MLGSMSTNYEFFEEELKAGAGWGRSQIKVGVGVIVNKNFKFLKRI